VPRRTVQAEDPEGAVKQVERHSRASRRTLGSVRTTLLAALAMGMIELACTTASGDGARTIALRTDGRVTIPSGVTYVKEFEPLPPNLLQASLYRFPSGAIFSLNISKPEAGPCSAVIDRERKQFEEAKSVPGLSELMRFSKAEPRLVGKHPSFYTEGGTRSAAEAKDGKAFHLGVSYSICLSHGLVGLTLAIPAGDITDADRKLFAAIVSSLNP
jgi:hypothetical protein